MKNLGIMKLRRIVAKTNQLSRARVRDDRWCADCAQHEIDCHTYLIAHGSEILAALQKRQREPSP